MTEPICTRHPLDCTVDKHAEEWRDEALRLRDQVDQLRTERDAAKLRSVINLRTAEIAEAAVATGRRDALLEAADDIEGDHRTAPALARDHRVVVAYWLRARAATQVPPSLPRLPSFTCPTCGRTSNHPQDFEYSYCGACHQAFD